MPGDDHAAYKGELTFIDNGVDRSTGTITARATIANPELHAAAGSICPCPPAAAGAARRADGAADRRIGSSQLGKYVYVVGDGQQGEQTLVSLGRPTAISSTS